MRSVIAAVLIFWSATAFAQGTGPAKLPPGPTVSVSVVAHPIPTHPQWSKVDVPYYKDTLGEHAQGDLYEMHNLVVGKTAPDIAGEDLASTTFKLSDYRGKVVMLDFWGNW